MSVLLPGCGNHHTKSSAIVRVRENSDKAMVCEASENFRGSFCPAGRRRPRFAGVHAIPRPIIHEPEKMTIETDRASIAHGTGTEPRDRASQNATSYRRALI